MKLKFDDKTIELLKEISSTTGLGASPIDDGPNVWWSDFDSYMDTNKELAQRLGLKVVRSVIEDPDEIETFPREKMGNDGWKIRDIDKEKMKKIVNLVGGKIIEKYLEKLTEQEIDNFLEENDIEYIEHIIKDNKE